MPSYKRDLNRRAKQDYEALVDAVACDILNLGFNHTPIQLKGAEDIGERTQGTAVRMAFSPTGGFGPSFMPTTFYGPRSKTAQRGSIDR